MAKGGELYVLDMGKPVKIKDLAERMIQLYGTGEEKIEYVGLRPGEKLYEELLRDTENDQATEKDRIFIAKQEKTSPEEIQEALRKLEGCLDTHGDVKKTLAEIVTTYHEPGQVEESDSSFFIIFQKTHEVTINADQIKVFLDEKCGFYGRRHDCAFSFLPYFVLFKI